MLFAFLLTVIMGVGLIVVDLGIVYVAKTELQNMVDAAALAGAQELPASKAMAETVAANYANMNRRAQDVVTATATVGADSLMNVTGRRTVRLNFGGIIGLATQDVVATAVVKVTGGAGGGIMPFGIIDKTYTIGQTYVLKENGGDGMTGNYGALDLPNTNTSGGGASLFEYNIVNGSSQTFKLHDWVSTEPGNMAGKTVAGVTVRVNGDPGATYSTVQEGSSRIIIVPILAAGSFDTGGKHDVEIVGFAKFFLEGVTGKDKDGNATDTENKIKKAEVTGRFIKLLSAEDIPAAGLSSGTRTIKLIQ